MEAMDLRILSIIMSHGEIARSEERGMRDAN